jgi:hypothetical protein
MNKRKRDEALMLEISQAIMKRMVPEQSDREGYQKVRISVTLSELQEQFPQVSERFLSDVLMNFTMTMADLQNNKGM